MNRISILLNERQALKIKLNNYKSLLNKTKSKNEIIRITKEMIQLNEKIKSIDLIIENLKGV